MTPKIAQYKYVLPKEVFEIENYEEKYYIIARVALECEDITYFASPNSTTFHKLLHIINSQFDAITQDIFHGTCQYLENQSPKIQRTLKPKLRANIKRSLALSQLKSKYQTINYAQVWPYLKLLVTWTGGSCGIALNSILPHFPKDMKVYELGYLASEMRGTITLNSHNNEGFPCLRDTFFEFVKKTDYEAENMKFVLLESLVEGELYYIFVTTKAGLYRYNMHDIIQAGKKFNQTPTFFFIQKGKGITNITGEKIFEEQIVTIMHDLHHERILDYRFFLLIADEEQMQYRFYIETSHEAQSNALSLQHNIDQRLQTINMEYQAKRQSGRLNPLKLTFLKEQSFEAYKRFYIEQGQREGQFKPTLLHYKKNLKFNISDYIDAN